MVTGAEVFPVAFCGSIFFTPLTEMSTGAAGAGAVLAAAAGFFAAAVLVAWACEWCGAAATRMAQAAVARAKRNRRFTESSRRKRDDLAIAKSEYHR